MLRLEIKGTDRLCVGVFGSKVVQKVRLQCIHVAFFVFVCNNNRS